MEHADLTAEHRDDRQLEATVSRLSLEPAVTAVSWTVLTDSPDATDDIPASGDTPPVSDPSPAAWRLRSPLTRCPSR